MRHSLSKCLWLLSCLGVVACGTVRPVGPSAADIDAVDALTADLVDGATDALAPDLVAPDADVAVPDVAAGDGSVDVATCATGCDDGDPCTAPDQCEGGACKAGAFACPNLVPTGIGASPCHLTGDLPQPAGIELKPWFTKLDLQQPIFLTAFPDGTDRMIAVLRPGQIVLFDNQPDVTTKKVVLDIVAQVSTAGEGGLLSVVFHPQFKKNRKFYVNYTTSGAKFQTVIVEYTLFAAVPGADPEVADPQSKRVLLTIFQPYSNHDGGQLFFDHKGMLLIGMGDGGSGGDPQKYGQNVSALLGKMLRIDVDKKGPGTEYAIPADNPFVGKPPVAPEIFALGLRNPWRFSVDRLTGAIWLADVGQGAWEEIDILESGKNYGWNLMEGNHCYGATTCDQTGLTLPVFEYPHTLGTSVTGGFVYRGSQNKSLYGAYLFADYGSGRFWALTKQGSTWKDTLLLQGKISPVTFGEDRDGELYVAQLYGAGGTVFKIIEAATKPPGTPLPLLLSQTQCFVGDATSPIAKLTPAQGLLPYDVAAPLWSDGAVKQRWIVLPAGQKALPAPPQGDLDAWDLPLGTLVIKHFALGTVPVETRFLRRDADGWNFFTYRWKPDASDAELVPGGGTTTTYAVDGKPASWRIPTISDCASCHKAMGSVSQLLGVQTGQLHRPVNAGGAPIDQLQVWKDAGLLDKTFDPGAHLGLPTPGEQPGNVAPALVEGHARAFLHANCAHCHRPGGTAQGTGLDLRFTTTLAQMQACGKPAQTGDVGGAAKAVVVPGQPELSALWLRMAADPQGPWFMPPMAVTVQSPGALALVKAWIAGLKACP